MDESRISQAEVNSMAYTDKKRKLKDELPDIPLPRKSQRNQFARGGESEPESADSNSYNFDTDSSMYTGDEAKSDHEDPETISSDMPASSSSASYSSMDFSLNSSESRSSAHSSSNEADSLSITEQPECPHHQHEEKNKPFGGGTDATLLEYGKYSIDQQCIDKQLENLLYSDGPASNSNYILSSGRLSVNQDDKKEGKKLTIDKEFEQYFSSLML